MQVSVTVIVFFSIVSFTKSKFKENINTNILQQILWNSTNLRKERNIKKCSLRFIATLFKPGQVNFCGKVSL